MKKERTYNIDVKFENLSSEVHALHQKLDKLNMTTTSTPSPSPICFVDTICDFCGNFGHNSQC